MRLVWLVLVAGCSIGDEATVTFFARARADLEPAQPAALASLDLQLGVYGDLPARAGVVLEGVWVGDEPRALALMLESPTLEHDARLVNVGVTNAELAGYCQTTVPIRALLGVPSEGVQVLSLRAELSVFCAP